MKCVVDQRTKRVLIVMNDRLAELEEDNLKLNQLVKSLTNQIEAKRDRDNAGGFSIG